MRPHFSLPFGGVYIVRNPPSSDFAPGQRVAYLRETYSPYDGDFTYVFARAEDAHKPQPDLLTWIVPIGAQVDPADYFEPADTWATDTWSRRLTP